MEREKVVNAIINKIKELDYKEPSMNDENYVVISVHANDLKRSLRCKTARLGIHNVRVCAGLDNIVIFYDDSCPDVKGPREIQATVDSIKQFIQQFLI